MSIQIIIWIIVFAILAYVLIYNGIISARNNVKENSSAIDTVFQNRYDLIPNLIEVVKKYTKHESKVLENVTKLRSGAMGTQEITPEKLAQENMISGTLKSIFALSENYPDLKADSQFLNLQNQWQEIEDRLQAARRWYNSAVKILKNKKEQIPSSFIASTMNIEDYPMFEADEKAKESVNAKELFNS